MIDIHFYRNVYELKQKLMGKHIRDAEYVWDKLEECRRSDPVAYNIETTNACNMRCAMCPRTTMMTRSIETMDMNMFKNVVEQIRPFSEQELEEWKNFVEKNYSIAKNDMSENHFFLYIIPKVLVLHGYGDPLLDKHMSERIKLLTQRNIPSYFSCNPANINIESSIEMFENGLGYIKYSIESVDDIRHKQIRGRASNFTKSYKSILHLLEIKKKRNYQTIIVITMLDFNSNWEKQEKEFLELKKYFNDEEYYVYKKSLDTQWLLSEKERHLNSSIHWSSVCKHPWMSMTILSNGQSAECMESFDGNVYLGNTKEESLYNIWNGETYKQFRKDHINLNKDIRCFAECDMKQLGDFLK